jgi:hypothetical protein
MPHKNIHLMQARHNEHLAADLDKMAGTPYPDWIATSEFYAALHYVEAFFDTLHPPIHHRKHLFREKTIEEREETSSIYEDYRGLKDLSEKARYFGQQLSAEKVRAEVFPSLESIKRQLSPYVPGLDRSGFRRRR